jgi:diaminopimelate decarboxylase
MTAKSSMPGLALEYMDNELFCDSMPLSQIAHIHGTPTYVYSLSELRKNAGAFVSASQELGDNCLVCYALKANGNLELLRLFAQMGLGADIVSGGELYLALRAGFDPRRIVFSGVGKTGQEIEDAIAAGILGLHIESQGELELVSQIARSLNRSTPIAVRVNPDIKVETHAHVATGQENHKFGVAPGIALSMMRAADADPWLRPVGLSAHLGSQIDALEPFVQVSDKLADMADMLATEGLRLNYIDLGGGLAIDYGQGSGPSIDHWLETGSKSIIRRGYRLLVEPGRSIVGSAGILLTKVLYTKIQGGQKIVVTDAGMTELVRPALYGAHHPIVPVVRPDESGITENEIVNVVGPVCETSDVLAVERSLPALEPGDLLAILQTGAYGFAMSSNYNGRLRPAEVLVDGDAFRCIRPRESYSVLHGYETIK